MTRNEVKRKEIIEQALLNCMNNMDEALAQMAALDTDNDNANYSKLSQSKSNIKRMLNCWYDRLARERSK